MSVNQPLSYVRSRPNPRGKSDSTDIPRARFIHQELSLGLHPR